MVAENRNVIRELVSESIKRLRTREQVVVRVNEEDLENLKEYKSELIMIIDSLEDVDIVADAKVDRGGCIVETENSMVDSRIETRMNKLKDEIEKLK